MSGNWLTNLLSSGFNTTVNTVADAADRFIETPDDRRKFKELLHEQFNNLQVQLSKEAQTTIQARANVIESDNSSDAYTRRARPTVIYYGLVVITINYLIVPMMQQVNGYAPKPYTLPVEFWYAWSGIASSWVLGRTAEKIAPHRMMTKLLNPRQAIKESLGDKLLK